MPPSNIISSIEITPPIPRVGQDTEITVNDISGHPVTITIESYVTIDGIITNRRWMRWKTPGKKYILILIFQNGLRVDQRLQIVEVMPGPAQPQLIVKRWPESPYLLSFSVIFPNQVPATSGKLHLFLDKVPMTTGTINKFKGPQRQKAPVPVNGKKESKVGIQTYVVYEWDFGDGTILGTDHGQFSHNYESHLDPHKEHNVFQMKVKIIHGQQIIVLHRTISILNQYAVGKRLGLIQPPVTYDHNAQVENNMIQAEMIVRNVEKFDIDLTSRQVEAIFYDTDRDSILLPSKGMPLHLKASDETTIKIKIPVSELPSDAVSFAVHYSGQSCGMPTHVSVYFDILVRWLRRKELILEPVLQKFLDDFISNKRAKNQKRISFQEIEDSVRRGNVVVPKPAAHGPGTDAFNFLAGIATKAEEKKPLKPRDEHTGPQFPVEGETCDPDNLPEEKPEGYECLATSESKWVVLPARFMNAKKGDIILSPGGTGLIGGLLRQVSPPQYYSHSGIMTRNYDELTHSTASEDRLLDYPNGSFAGTPAPTDGHRPDALKYLWPGVITQSVEHTVYGESYVDPDDTNWSPQGPKKYTISGFYPNNKWMPDTGELVHPRVVKPKLGLEVQNPQIRQQLHNAANWAIAQLNKSHYRFFCYTDPLIAYSDPENNITSKAPLTDSVWAVDTFPSVCSSFVWMSVRQTNAVFEGINVESSGKGEDLPTVPVDGLYLYHAEERLNAALWLYQALYDMVVEKAEIEGPEGLITAFTDMPDDIANQILNTFASDHSDTEYKDSEEWKNTIDARAVSPDNILFWDGPENGGLYGYSEPLVFRPESVELVYVHRWKNVKGYGSISGTVIEHNKGPLADAQVKVTADNFTATDDKGHFTLPHVPEGPHIVQADKFDETGMHLSGSSDLVSVERNKTTYVTIEAKPPSNYYRAITLHGLMKTVDYEWNAAADPTSWLDLSYVLNVGPNHTYETYTFVDVCDGDVRSEFKVEAVWDPTKVVNVLMTLRLFATADPADGIDKEVASSFHVYPGHTGHWEGMYAVNNDGNSVEVQWFTATNDLWIT